MELGALGVRRRRGPAMTTRQRMGKRAIFHHALTSPVTTTHVEPMEVDPPPDERMEVDPPAEEPMEVDPPAEEPMEVDPPTA